jgi:pectate lyase
MLLRRIAAVLTAAILTATLALLAGLPRSNQAEPVDPTAQVLAAHLTKPGKGNQKPRPNRPTTTVSSSPSTTTTTIPPTSSTTQATTTTQSTSSTTQATTTTTQVTSSTQATTTTAPPVVAAPSSGRPIGYGAGATGGTTACAVTTTAASGPGSLRSCAEPGGKLITFAVSGTIDLSAADIDVASNTTIDGHGQDVTIVGRLDIKSVSNVIIRHLTFTGSSEDSIRVLGSRTLWFDHLEMYASADGLIDITDGSTDVTVSWSHFRNHDKVSLVNGVVGGTRARVTYHHNWFDHTGRRYPSAEVADIHGFNNFMDGWVNYAVVASEGTIYISEANVYKMSGNDNALLTIWQDEAPGFATSSGDEFIGTVEVQVSGGPFSVPYGYSLDPASSVISLVTSGAGPNR